MREKFLLFVKYYLPAIFWAGVIFYFSSIPGLRYSKSVAEEIILRKGAHFVEFFILSFLFWRILWRGHKIKVLKAYWLSLVFVGAYGFFDEFHQTLVFGRTGKIIDAFFDFFSVIFSLEIITVFIKRKISLKNIIIILSALLALTVLETKMIIDGSSGEKQPIDFIIKNEIDKIKNDLDGKILEKKEINREEGDNFEVENKNNRQEETEIIPPRFFLDVPFTSQAPFKNWDEIHEEACEESSIIMLEYYLKNKKLTPEIAEEEIQNLVKFQIENNGDYRDTTAQETVDLFLNFYGEIKNGRKLRVVYDFSKEDIKKYLIKGYPVIVPAAGRKLGNPNFKNPGPLYHNLIVVGYDGDIFITNDPGTRKGEGYRYSGDILYDAIHDFPGKPEDIESGRKAMIIVE